MSFPGAGELSGMGGRLTFLFGLLLALSALTGWYTGEGNGTTVSVIGWHTGTIGKIVLFLGLAAVLLVVLREVGVNMPASVPESLVTIGVGSVATILVLVRIISIPDSFFFANRGARDLDQPRLRRRDHPRRAARGLRRALSHGPVTVTVTVRGGASCGIGVRCARSSPCRSTSAARRACARRPCRGGTRERAHDEQHQRPIRSRTSLARGVTGRARSRASLSPVSVEGVGGTKRLADASSRRGWNAGEHRATEREPKASVAHGW